MTTLPDIPRLYTALAEVLAALMYAHRLPPRMDQRVIWGVEAGWAVLLGAFLQATGKVPLAWWIPCMAMAILSMLLFLWVTRSITLLEAGYVCARAFILAELAASVEWQLHCVLWPQRGGAEPLSLLLLAAVYGNDVYDESPFDVQWMLEMGVLKPEFVTEGEDGELYVAPEGLGLVNLESVENEDLALYWQKRAEALGRERTES